MLTLGDLKKVSRDLSKGLTLKNWAERLRVLTDVYADMEIPHAWDHHEACAYLVRSGKRPVKGIETGYYFWATPSIGSFPTESYLKPSFVYRIDTINGQSSTKRLLPQLIGFLEAWRDGGRPQGKDKKRLSNWILNRIEFKNWFSCISALRGFCYLPNSPEIDACNWIFENQKRPWQSLDGHYHWMRHRMLSTTERMGYACCVLSDGFVFRVDGINKRLSTSSIKPQLTAFLQAWREGLRP